ncbi:hypothetical protein [Vibrio gigantis]|uniref:hypothetical protein n=1 Tax=Vibrio gigantis TaxID=296199 RepID=UPI001BFDFF96|nr:hypothetical protein [Vibrio gigantis]
MLVRKLLVLIFVCYSLNASAKTEGRYWMDTEYSGKAMVIASYESGYFSGCVYGVDTASDSLISKKETAMKESFRLMKKCPFKTINNQQDMSKTIGMIDTAYLTPGAAKIPVLMMIKLAFDAKNNNKSEIDKSSLNNLIKN